MKHITHDDRIKTMIKLLTVSEFVEDNNDSEWLQFVEDIKEIINYFEKEKYPMIKILIVRKGGLLMNYGTPIWLNEDTEVKYYGDIHFKGKSVPLDRSKGVMISTLPEGSLLQLNGVDVWTIHSTQVNHYKDLSIEVI